MLSELPIGVVLPTLNVRPALPDHLTCAQTWLPLVREIVVVDSDSTDGTLEFLEKNLRHPNVRLLKHPRGLYQSWNYGLQQLTSEFAYISTIGDAMAPEGLPHLLEVLTRFQADLVVSPPDFVDTAGRPVQDQWPIHKLLAACPLDQPKKLNRCQMFLLSILESPAGMMGSSAANLYRTKTFQRLPLPTDYGHAGDSAWALRHAWDVDMAVTPRALSRFTVHPNANTGMDHSTFRALVAQFDELAYRTGQQRPADYPCLGWTGEFIEAFVDLPLRQHALWEAQAQYDAARREFFPWFAHWKTWQARGERNRRRAVLRAKSKESTRKCAALDLEAACGDDFAASVNRYLLERIRKLAS